MAKYIELEVALNAVTDLAGKASTRSAYEAIWKSARALEKIPAADAVVVTRCKDCAYGDPTWAGYVCNCNEYAALESTLYHDENFFCAYGEPKEDTP